MGILLVVLGLMLFVGLVVVHEFGHYIAAKRNGIDVKEFGIGFPPRAKVLTVKKGTTYTLNWLPLGGFVRLKGENDSAEGKGTYGSASLRTKVKIMLAGVGMNFVTAVLLFTLLALVGMPKLVDNQFTVDSDTKIVKKDILVAYVEPDSPADQAGLTRRSQLIGYRDLTDPACPDGQECLKTIDNAKQLPEITESLAGKNIELVFEQNGQTIQTPVTLRSSDEVEQSRLAGEPKGYLGVSPAEYEVRRSTWSAPITALGLSFQIIGLTLKALGSALWALIIGNTAQASAQVAGPVGIFVLIRDGSLLGYQFILMIMAIISLTLAIINSLPIPALDGGRLFVTGLFRFLNKVSTKLGKGAVVLTRKWEESIHGTGFALLMLLFVLITIVDVRRFF